MTSKAQSTSASNSQSDAGSTVTAQAQGSGSSKTYELRVPKKKDRRVFVSKFSNALGVDFTKWKDNAPEFVREGMGEQSSRVEEERSAKTEVAGSEFGKEKRDEARRKKYTARHKNPEDVPWIMTEASTKKKYRGTKEGGVQENSAYYVFTPKDGRIEAYPISEWFNFVPIQRYKTLDTEEAEEAFGRRDKVFNYFNIMYKKRLKATGEDGEDNEEEDGAEGKAGPSGGARRKSNLVCPERIPEIVTVQAKKVKIPKISDGDDDLPAEMSDSEEEGGAKDAEALPSEKKGKKGKGKGKKVVKPKKKKTQERDDEDAEPAEESDDGDYETREVDYESSEPEEEMDELLRDREVAPKGVDEEVEEMADEEDDEEETTEKEKTETAQDDNPAGSESDNDEEDFDAMADSVLPQKRTDSGDAGAGSSTSGSKKSTSAKSANGKGKRKQQEPSTEKPAGPSKKAKTDKVVVGESLPPPVAAADGKMDEETLVRRYLERKPLTSKELLRKLTKHGVRTADNLNIRLGEIIKRLNPEKTTINGKLYLHLKK